MKLINGLAYTYFMSETLYISESEIVKKIIELKKVLQQPV